eukprot:c9687_g1_i1.p1 GENE.c9687_g1_i1~~c9687_g1_i1.p1  ORF type:complete len:106 (+),score=6.62 c9687_g1_i1:219-536(+)
MVSAQPEPARWSPWVHWSNVQHIALVSANAEVQTVLRHDHINTKRQRNALQHGRAFASQNLEKCGRSPRLHRRFSMKVDHSQSTNPSRELLFDRRAHMCVVMTQQ